MDPGVGPVLFQYGVAGVVIFLMALAIYRLYTDNKELAKENRELQEKYVTDMTAMGEKVITTMNGFSQAVSMVSSKIRSEPNNRRVN
jgi:hypothetical protein